MILNEIIKPSFEDYLKQIKQYFMGNVPDMSENDLIDTHVNAFKEFYQDCYNDDLTAEQAVQEDMQHWEED